MVWFWAAVLVAVALTATVYFRGRAGQAIPSALSNFPADLASPEVQPHGIWGDGWVDRDVHLVLNQPGGKCVLAVKGMVPGIVPGVRCSLRVFLDGEEIGTSTLDPGEFYVQAPVDAASGKRRIELRFSQAQRLPDPDGRTVSARIFLLGFQPGPKAARIGLEIVAPGSGIALGEGWGALETFADETFRWVRNDAALRVDGVDSPSRRFTLEIEPGPGFDWKPFTLRVYDSAGAQVSAVEIRKRQKIQLDLPVRAGAGTEYRLHVDGGGKATKSDPRILNFRVFSIASVRP